MKHNDERKRQKAYQTVFRDMMLNGTDMFKGKYDAKNGSKKFMSGIQTVMEYIALNADGENHVRYSQTCSREIWLNVNNVQISKNE